MKVSNCTVAFAVIMSLRERPEPSFSSRSIVGNSGFVQKIPDSLTPALFAGFGRTMTSYCSERAQDEFGILVLTRLSSVRHNHQTVETARLVISTAAGGTNTRLGLTQRRSADPERCRARARINCAHSTVDLHAAFCQRISQHRHKRQRRIGNRDAARPPVITKRHASGNLQSVRAEAAIDLQITLRSARRRRRAIRNRHERCRRTGRNHYRRADFLARLHSQIDRIVVNGQSTYLRAVRPLQIFPFPTAAQRRAIEITFVADQIAFDALHSGGHDAIGEIVDAFEVVAVIEARGNRRIAATVDNQIAFDRAFIRLFFRVNGSDEVIVRREPIERRRDG